MKTNNACCEQLESRRLMSISLVSGVLKVVGTSGNDDISISLNPEVADDIVININGNIAFYGLLGKNIERVEIHGLEGNDRLWVRNGDGDFPIGVLMKGGSGD